MGSEPANNNKEGTSQGKNVDNIDLNLITDDNIFHSFVSTYFYTTSPCVTQKRENLIILKNKRVHNFVVRLKLAGS